MALPDCPLVFVNFAFCKLTGYDTDECVGRNCRFLQGEGTDREAVAKLRKSLKTGNSIEICLRNYRKSGQPFDNLLIMKPFQSNDRRELVLGCQYQIDASGRVSEHLKRVHGVVGKLSLEEAGPRAHSFEAYRMRAESIRVLLEAHRSRDEVLQSWLRPASRPPKAAGE
ncbi:MAG: PAS domain-containing protein [Paracoccaceae bacterium]|nr:PAS domain-containing protein [Paracoccaceae bacterium]